MQIQQGSTGVKLLLWFAFLGPLGAWFMHLMGSYTLITYACSRDMMWILHLITVVAVGLAGAGIGSGWRAWRLLQIQGSQKLTRGKEFTALLLMLLGVFYILAIMFGELSNFLLETCQ